MSKRTETTRDVIGTREWVRLRVHQALQYLHRCSECKTRPDRRWRSLAPRWDEDPVVNMLGAFGGRCGRCGALLPDRRESSR